MPPGSTVCAPISSTIASGHSRSSRRRSTTRPTSTMTASARKAVREIVATMPITISSAHPPKRMRRHMSRTRIAIASESGRASESATPSAIGCCAEASARIWPLRTSAARSPVSCRNGNTVRRWLKTLYCVRVSTIAANATMAPPTMIALMQRSTSARERTPEATSTNTIGNVSRYVAAFVASVPSMRSVNEE